MADSIDWTDETLRPLDELARLAFPDGGVTADTLKRRARTGQTGGLPAGQEGSGVSEMKRNQREWKAVLAIGRWRAFDCSRIELSPNASEHHLLRYGSG
jgi:hypothetical protein